jgi:hypothetical protein
VNILGARLRLARASLGLLGWLLWSQTAAAQTAAAPIADSGVTRTQEPPEAELPAYHHTVFSFENQVSAQTLGVGDTPQSYNPTYTMGLYARTRYYLVDNTPKGEHFSLRVDGGLSREFTNNDATTRRGEWTFLDTDLAAVYVRRFAGPDDKNGAMGELRPLTLLLPTSKTSYDSGRYFAVGATAGLIHVTPLLRGRVGPEVSSTERIAIGYRRWFARATVPTNASLERVRLTPDGHTLPSDALTGSSLVRDQLEHSARLRLELGQNLLWTTDFGFSPSWKYDLQDHVELCGVVATGCTDVQVAQDDQRYLVRTQFNTELSVRIARAFSIDLGYGNISNQIGRDGRRRSVFYSPEAVLYLALSFFPHELTVPPQLVAERNAAPSRF